MGRHKTIITVSFTIILSITLVCLLAAYLSNAVTVNFSSNELEEFTCQPDSNYPFTVWARVNLDVGISKSEAILVAAKVFSHEMTNAKYLLKSATVNAAGVWTVKFSWGIGQEPLSHYFNVEINPFNQTATYDRCY